MRTQYIHTYQYIISLENLLEAWKEFAVGKRQRKDVQKFELHLMDNIILLHNNLISNTYTHSMYHAFNISDPKPRNIHKASVRDRLLHHAIYRTLYPFFDRTFIADSYSCRLGKGTHGAIKKFSTYALKASRNHTKTLWILKCDIRKFFASIDQAILLKIIGDYIPDQDIIWLISRIIGSFHSTGKGKGLPLGNLTSQLLVNIYMNRFDQFVKHKIKAKCYIRYADDFVIFSQDRKWLENLLPLIRNFLWSVLKLQLHPDKVYIKTIASGVDFLGWVHFPDHKVLRQTTMWRMIRRVNENSKFETLQSYLGLLKHGNTSKLKQVLLERYLYTVGNKI